MNQSGRRILVLKLKCKVIWYYAVEFWAIIFKRKTLFLNTMGKRIHASLDIMHLS